MGEQDLSSQNGSLPFKTGELKHMLFFFFLNWDLRHARLEQPLGGMELQKTEAQKD